MGNIGGKRNYGYGKQPAWAGQQALRDRYGSGHYATQAAHGERWTQFVKYIKEQNINDARNITKEVIEQYANTLKQSVEGKTLSVAYAQNLLSTVNVVLETMRKDRELAISPRQWVGERSHVRTSIPVSANKNVLEQINNVLNVNTQSQPTHKNSRSDTLASQVNFFTSHVNYRFTNNVSLIHSDSRQHVLMIAKLARDFGLRFREASLLDSQHALKEAQQYNRINITQGTKGGRGKEKDRWVPVNRENLQTLHQAAQMQEQNRNLIPAEMSYIQWRNHAYSQWRQIAKPFGIKGFHELRAAYACERYQQLTGHLAPVMTDGQRTAPKPTDQQARIILAQELGHGRTDVIAQYIGSAR